MESNKKSVPKKLAQAEGKSELDLVFKTSQDENHSSEIDDEYDEEEDEDYNPDQNTEGVNRDDDKDDELENDKEFKKLEQQYQNIEASGTAGGLVKTRRSRLAEEAELRKTKYDNAGSRSINSGKVLSVWDNLKKQASERLQSNKSISALADTDSRVPMSNVNNNEDLLLSQNKIKIKRSYKFAGQVHTEEKWVDKSSAEAKEYLNSLKFSTGAEHLDDADDMKDSKPLDQSKVMKNRGLRRPLKRPPMLEKIISGSLKPKLSTLEKSKIDWAGFVDTEGIHDELQQNIKSGYLHKQDFLHRVDIHKDEQYKKMRQKELAEKFNNK